MDNFSTHVGEKFAASVITVFYEEAVTPMISNQEYEGVITGGGADRLNILSISEDQGLQNYTGADLTLGALKESEGTFIADQKKAYYFGIKSWDKFKSYVSDPKSDIITQKAGELVEAVDAYVLGLYGDVAAGNRVGTNYVTGTVEIAVTTGVVTGTGTTFTAAMVGKGFKAAGHTQWYRVKTYTSATSITIEDDLDDTTSAYTGGAISAGATYIVEAATPVTVDKTTIYSYIVDLKTKLNHAKVPKKDRWLVVNSDISGLLDKSTEFTHATVSGDETLRNGRIGRIASFMVYESEQIAGDSVNGLHILAGHKSAIVYAMAFTETGTEDLQKNFGKAYKGLNCYGAKVVDRRRSALAELFCKI